MKSAARSTLVFVIATALSGWAGAADTYSSASITLSNLSYQLTSLDAGAGVTPSLVAKGGVWTGLSLNANGSDYQQIGVPLTSGGLLGGASNQTTAITPDGLTSVTYGGATLSTSTNVPGSTPLGAPVTSFYSTPTTIYGTLADGTYGPMPATQVYTYETSTYATGGAAALCPSDVSQCAGSGVMATFTLSAHTAVDISGSATMSLIADRTGLINHYQTVASQIGSDGSTFAYGGGALAATASIVGGDASIDPNNWDLSGSQLTQASSTIEFNTDAFSGSDYAYKDNALTSSQASQQDMRFHFENNGAQAMDIAIVIAITTNYQETVTKVASTIVTDVPEPATSSLMGLGLGGLMMLARRRRSA